MHMLAKRIIMERPWLLDDELLCQLLLKMNLDEKQQEVVEKKLLTFQVKQILEELKEKDITLDDIISRIK